MTDRHSDVDTASEQLCWSKVCYIFPVLLNCFQFFICFLLGYQIKKIGIVVRKGRRKIANVDDFIQSFDGMGERWCQQRMPLSTDCGIIFEKVMFGKEREEMVKNISDLNSSVENDIIPLQEYAVLFGIQVFVLWLVTKGF